MSSLATRRAPAECWWARTLVESTLVTHSSSPAASVSPWISCNSRSQVPSWVQRLSRFHAVCQGPNEDGRSRHGDPVPYRHAIASITCR